MKKKKKFELDYWIGHIIIMGVFFISAFLLTTSSYFLISNYVITTSDKMTTGTFLVYNAFVWVLSAVMFVSTMQSLTKDEV